MSREEIAPITAGKLTIGLHVPFFVEAVESAFLSVTSLISICLFYRRTGGREA